jgi:hypothetical protein
MTDAYFRLTVDEPQKLITFRLKGAQSSEYYTAKFISAYAMIDRPWLYRRLMDHRHCETTIDFEDVQKLADHWADITRGTTEIHHVAILTADALTRARPATYSHLFPNQEIRSFTELHDALDWLLSVPVTSA